MRKAAVPPLLLILASGVWLAGCDTLSARMDVREGNTYYKNEKYKDALAKFQKAIATDPSLKQVWRSVAMSAVSLYRPGVETTENKQYATTTIDAFKKYLEAYPDDTKAHEFLIGTFMNAGKYPEVLAYLQGEAQKNPGDVKANKAIAQIYLQTQRIKEAYDWVQAHIPNKDSEAYYLVTVYCWDKAYRDASISPQVRNEYVELGLKSVDQALRLQPNYFDALIYTNLLYREKAKLQTNETLRQGFFDKAEEYRAKAMALRDKNKTAGK